MTFRVKDIGPRASAEIRSVKCSDCEWEAVFAIPEELDAMLTSILKHVADHGIVIPKFIVMIH